MRTCPECFGTGLKGGFQAPCSRGCKVPDLPVPVLQTDLTVEEWENEPEDIETPDLSEQTGPWIVADLAEDGRIPRPDLIEEDVKALAAVANYLDLDGSQVSEAEVNGHTGSGIWGYGYSIEVDGEEYSVLTEDEAEQAWEDSLDNYLEECVLSELDGPLANYFDREAWKRDARHDGRGHSLSPYDGNEGEGEVDGETYYVYRTN